MTTRGIRARVREELTREIKDAARRQLAEHGASGLSVRAVTRELGMASSAAYRYFPSRDALLTALIIDAYEGVGHAARQAEEQVRREDYRGRWHAVFRAVRGWALEHPHEYALIYGSPVPGYAAPQDTAGPASAVALLLAQIALDAAAAGAADLSDSAGAAPEPSAALTDDIAGLLARIPDLSSPQASDALAGAGPSVVLSVIDAWTMLFGAVSFEMFGHYQNVIEARGDYLDRVATRAAAPLGL